MIRKQTYVYKTAGDCEIRADVHLPPDSMPRCVILWVHGGALILGDRAALSADQLDRYLRAGYAVVAVDYRLAPEAKLPAIIEDLQDAYRWVLAKGSEWAGIGAEQVGVVGHSAGGYLSLMAGFCVNPRPGALVSFYGYGDIAGHWYSRPDSFYRQQPLVSRENAYRGVGGRVLTGTSFAGGLAEHRSRFYLYCRQQGRWPREVTGHDPDQEPEWFESYCPVRNVTPEYPPTMLIHGEEDTDVPFEQSLLMSEALKRHGVEHELIALAGRGHGFDGEGMEAVHVSHVFDRVLRFLETHGL
jgi:acetyl esterase/lipase